MKQITLKPITGKLSAMWAKFWTLVLQQYHEIRMQYILGLSRERFAFAEFYVNGRKDIRSAKSFEEVQTLVRHFEKQYHFRHLSDFMLLRMWCSRRTFQIKSKDVRIDVMTFWYF